MVDEDLSDCNKQEEAEVDYELRLVTNVAIELTTKLTTVPEMELSDALSDNLSHIFTDYAHDVDLSFYDTVGDSLRLQHDKHIMDANEASYTLNLPKRHYMHLAAANLINNTQVSLTNDERCHPSMLQQTDGDTISSHTTCLFTARRPIEIQEGIDQDFNVCLYMANCAACLVIDPRGLDTENIRVYSTGFATGFGICDSVYQFKAASPIVRTARVDAEKSGLVGFCSVTFPSREPVKSRKTRTVIETEEPFIEESGSEPLWEFRVYVPRHQDGRTRSRESITETILRVKEPLRPGEFKIIKGWLGSDSSVRVDDQEVATSVTLDWQEGLIFKN